MLCGDKLKNGKFRRKCKKVQIFVISTLSLVQICPDKPGILYFSMEINCLLLIVSGNDRQILQGSRTVLNGRLHDTGSKQQLNLVCLSYIYRIIDNTLAVCSVFALFLSQFQRNYHILQCTNT